MLTNQQLYGNIRVVDLSTSFSKGTNSMVDRFERFSYAISEISRCWHRIAGEVMGNYELKGSYSVYFTTLYRYPEGITAAQLGELCSRDKADVSRAMALLEKKGFIIRQETEGKAYRAKLSLTEKGMALAEQINEKAAAAVEFASRGLPADKRGVFYEALELITGNLQKLSKEGL